MRDEIKVLIVDDHPIFRRGLRQVVEADARLNVVEEAENGGAAQKYGRKQDEKFPFISLHIVPANDQCEA